MNQAQQAERAMRVGRSAERRIAAHVDTEAPRGDFALTYAWCLVSALRTIAGWQAMIGRKVAELTAELRSDRCTRETVSELLAWVRLSNASITDYFAIVEAKTTVTRSHGRDGWMTTERLSDEELWTMANEWNSKHGQRAHDLVMRKVARDQAQRLAPSA